MLKVDIKGTVCVFSTESSSNANFIPSNFDSGPSDAAWNWSIVKLYLYCNLLNALHSFGVYSWNCLHLKPMKNIRIGLGETAI